MDKKDEQKPQPLRPALAGNILLTRRESEDLRDRDWSQLK